MQGPFPCLPALLMMLFAGLLLGWLPRGVPLLEAGYPSASVQNLLLACVERMAVSAHVGVDDAVRCGAARRESVATRTSHQRLCVRGMNVRLHACLLIMCAGSPRIMHLRREPAPKGDSAASFAAAPNDEQLSVCL